MASHPVMGNRPFSLRRMIRADGEDPERHAPDITGAESALGAIILHLGPPLVTTSAEQRIDVTCGPVREATPIGASGAGASHIRLPTLPQRALGAVGVALLDTVETPGPVAHRLAAPLTGREAGSEMALLCCSSEKMISASRALPVRAQRFRLRP